MLDSLDRKIANHLQQDLRLSVERLAETVNLSPSAVHRRIAKLRELGAISAEVAVLNPKVFEAGMAFIVEIVLEKVRVAEVGEIKEALKKAPEVQQIYNVTGDIDLFVIMRAKSVEHFEDLCRDLFSSNEKVKRYRTSVVLDAVKTGQTISVLNQA